MSDLAALRYYGGKSAHARQGTGRWIASMLPVRGLYVEPFAGMLGVLLQRPRSALELVSDIDCRLITWWRVVRDMPDEFGFIVEHTPYSRDEFERCVEVLDDDEVSPIDMALAVHVVLSQSLRAGLSAPVFAPRYFRGTVGLWRDGQVKMLSDRIRRVQLETRDASEILSRTAGITDSVVYVDPPYRTTDTSPYAEGCLDIDRLSEALLSQEGLVAVSGSGDEWDHLGWHRHTLDVPFVHTGESSMSRRREEVLWTNFEPMQQRLF